MNWLDPFAKPKLNVELSKSTDKLVEEPNISTTNSTCEHHFVVQILNGYYVSVCSKCGKIGETKQAFKTF